MGNSNKGFLALLVGGIIYGVLKLGDEFIIIIDEVKYLIPAFDDVIPNIIEATNFGLVDVILLLIVAFLVIAIFDYASK